MVEWKTIIIVMAIIGIATTALVNMMDEMEDNYNVSPPSDNSSSDYINVYNQLKAYTNISKNYAEDVSEDIQKDEGITLTSGASAISKGIIAALKIVFAPITIGLTTITDIVTLLGFPAWVGDVLITVIIMTILSIVIAAIIGGRLRGY